MFFTATLGTLALVIAMEGYCFTNLNPLLRLLYAAAGVTMMVPEKTTDTIGLILGAALFASSWWWVKRKKLESPSARISSENA